jgi:hypothetical protein
MCANDGEADQVRRLLAFLAPVVSLQTFPDRFDAYQETWVRLNPAAAEEIWQTDMSVNFPWSSGKVDLWRTLRLDIERKFQTALNEHLKGEFTNRPVVAFSFMDYSEMLLELLDVYLKGLDKYIATQNDIEKVTADMDAYPEDMRDLLVKGMRTSGLNRAKEFLDVILFMHAVPQRVDGRWDVLDHESDVTWFREYCEVYQKNEELMTFLRDCAVAVLVVGDFYVAPNVIMIHDCYKHLI